MKCDGDEYDCYIVDSSGYIVLSMKKSEVGQFFGSVNEHVLQSFLDKNIFDHVEVFNYQALCHYFTVKQDPNRSFSLLTVSITI